MPNYERVIDKLVAKSEEGTLPWKPTADDNIFIVALEGEVTFEIARLPDGGFALLMKDTDGRKVVEVSSHKREHYHEDYIDNDRFFGSLERLFEAARVTALEVEKKLDAAQNLLDRL